MVEDFVQISEAENVIVNGDRVKLRLASLVKKQAE
jgi:hypothetical protein